MRYDGSSTAARGTTLNTAEDERTACSLVAMPLRHLAAARVRCASATGVVDAAGGRSGRARRRPPGVTVLVIATEAGDAEVPAATWRGDARGARATRAWRSASERTARTWVEEHARPEAGVASDDERGEAPDDDEDEDDGDDDDEDPMRWVRRRSSASRARALTSRRWVPRTSWCPSSSEAAARSCRAPRGWSRSSTDPDSAGSSTRAPPRPAAPRAPRSVRSPR